MKIHHAISGKRLRATLLRREIAYKTATCRKHYAGTENGYIVKPVSGGSSKPSFATCQYRYPSPCRFAFPGGPANSLRIRSHPSAKYRASPHGSLAGPTLLRDVFRDPRNKEHWITWSNDTQSSPQRLFSALPVVSKPISRAALPVQPSARPRPIRSEPTRRRRLSQAHPLRSSATMRASARRPATEKRAYGPARSEYGPPDWVPAAFLRLKEARCSRRS